MNKLIYTLLNKINEPRNIEDKYLNYLYNFYVKESKIRNCEVNINEKDFRQIFKTIYDVLILKFEEKEFNQIVQFYLNLLIADAYFDGVKVDNKWFINHLWYLTIGIKDEKLINKYKDCIPFIQKQLIKEFNIKEKPKEKIKRKVYTRFLSI